MWWKFFVGLLLGLFSGCIALASFFLTGDEHRAPLPSADSDYSSQNFSNLSAEEINRRTLKAAAAIEISVRRY
jgi:hypothetical protein